MPLVEIIKIDGRIDSGPGQFRHIECPIAGSFSMLTGRGAIEYPLGNALENRRHFEHVKGQVIVPIGNTVSACALAIRG